jgi:F-type H+-transporting ATPase subunit b
VEVDPLIALLTTIPFLITVFGLNMLIWKPTLALLAEREKNIEGFLTEADRLQAEVATRESELEGKLGEARTKAVAERNRLRRAAQAAERALIDEARGIADARMSEARAVLAAERTTAQAEVQASVSALGVGIATAVLGRTVEAD